MAVFTGESRKDKSYWNNSYAYVSIRILRIIALKDKTTRALDYYTQTLTLSFQISETAKWLFVCCFLFGIVDPETQVVFFK